MNKKSKYSGECAISERIIVRTNHHWRPLLSGYELSKSEQKEFDYIDNIEESFNNFFLYKGIIHSMDDFMAIPASSPLPGGWDGYTSDSFFSGLLMRYNDEETDSGLEEMGYVKIATWIS